MYFIVFDCIAWYCIASYGILTFSNMYRLNTRAGVLPRSASSHFMVLQRLHGVVQIIWRAGELPRSASSHFIYKDFLNNTYTQFVLCQSCMWPINKSLPANAWFDLLKNVKTKIYWMQAMHNNFAGISHWNRLLWIHSRFPGFQQIFQIVRQKIYCKSYQACSRCCRSSSNYVQPIFHPKTNTQNMENCKRNQIFMIYTLLVHNFIIGSMHQGNRSPHIIILAICCCIHEFFVWEQILI